MPSENLSHIKRNNINHQISFYLKAPYSSHFIQINLEMIEKVTLNLAKQVAQSEMCFTWRKTLFIDLIAIHCVRKLAVSFLITVVVG